jgi:N-acetylglucosaminyldiphosphoundecaprenol N-acetyl-beta-D-mannosaminyltransferase
MFILGVRIDNLSMDGVLAKVRDFLSDGLQHHIVTPNPEIILLAQEDDYFKAILNKADLAIPDGIGIKFASMLMGERLKEKVSGVDLMEKILRLKENPLQPSLKGGSSPPLGWGGGDFSVKIFLLGGWDGVAEKIAAKYPAVAGFSENEKDAQLSAQIVSCGANILLVALGAPRQEKWITENLAKMPSVKLAMGVGGAFDFLSGKIRRAPKFVRQIGLEWLWRLILEPKRLPRIFQAAVVFPFRAIFKNQK